MAWRVRGAFLEARNQRVPAPSGQERVERLRVTKHLQ